jgi:hypothetical protein
MNRSIFRTSARIMRWATDRRFVLPRVDVDALTFAAAMGLLEELADSAFPTAHGRDEQIVEDLAG